MKKFNKISIVTALAIVYAFAGPVAALAVAVAPALGDAASFAVLGNSTVTNTGSTVLYGDLGLYSGTAITGFSAIDGGPGVYTGYTLHKTDALAHTAQGAVTSAYTALSTQSCTGDHILTGQDLGGMTLTPGVYCFGTSAGLTGILTLNALGDPNAVWVFQIGSTLTTASSSSVVFSNPGSGTPGCNVFWNVGTSATLGTSTDFTGNIISHTGAITFTTSATLYGRALASGTAVTLDTNHVTVPTCAVTTTTTTTTTTSGGSLHVPIIDIVKVPSPLSLPNGPGPVTYTYTVRNIGTVPMNNVTVVDDICSPMVFVSGDTNSDSSLDVKETWTYNCFKTLSATQTNTVVATGWNNGFNATDIAIATVVVGVPIVPPLIHVTKIPNPFALPAGGGTVTYTETVTNPGIVALSNVQIADDKCGPVKYISGDINGDLKLAPAETWTYTCQTNLIKTTTNTVTVSGQANGLTARDFAIVTVGVATSVPAFTPALPNTGFPPEQKSSLWNIIILAGIAMLALVSLVFVVRKRTT